MLQVIVHLNSIQQELEGKMRERIIMIMLFVLSFALSVNGVMAAANFQVVGFSCTPSEVAVNDVFSCTAQVKNVGDGSGSISMATLYAKSPNWLENSNYPKSSGTSVSAGQSIEIIFTGLKAVNSGINGFSKIMLDDVSDTYVSDNAEVNVIDVVASQSSSVSSSAMGGEFDVTGDVIAGGNIDVVLTFDVLSGGCSIGSESASKTISGMLDGNTQSRVWSVSQGTSGACRYSISAAATGSGGIANKLDSSTGSVSCSDCPVSSSSSSGGGSGGGGGGSTTINATTSTYYMGVLDSTKVKEMFENESIGFKIEDVSYAMIVKEVREASALVRFGENVYLIPVGEEKNIDLDNDGISEVSIKLKQVNLITKKATFVFNPSSLVPSAPTPEEPKMSNIVEAIGSNKTYLMIGAGILAGVVIAIIILVILRFTKAEDKGKGKKEK